MISVISRYVFKIPGEIRALWQVGMSVCMMFIEYESDIIGGMARTTCWGRGLPRFRPDLPAFTSNSAIWGNVKCVFVGVYKNNEFLQIFGRKSSPSSRTSRLRYDRNNLYLRERFWPPDDISAEWLWSKLKSRYAIDFFLWHKNSIYVIESATKALIITYLLLVNW